MTSLTVCNPSSDAAPGSRRKDGIIARRAMFVGLAATALLVRHAMLGNPLAGFDEQFYLMVGDRMWQGAWPYVDIWDRKPLGLFVIYAVIRVFGGDGVWQSQMAATLFAGATAIVIAQMVIRGRADGRSLVAGYAAGALYLLFLNVFGGAVGQAPVFYNLFMAGAAACVQAVIADPEAETAARRAMLAMILCGLALTVKTTAIFESLLFGLLPLLAWWRAGVAPARIVRRTMVMLVLGAAPFLLCAAPYALTGRFEAFWFANARSAMLRPRSFTIYDRFQLMRTLILMSPMLVMALLGRHRLPEEGRVRRFLTLWLIAAAVGALSVGIYYDHYAMNMLVPLSVCCGAYFRTPVGRIAFVAVSLAPLHLAFVTLPAAARSNEESWTALRSAITPRVERECMLVFHGPPALFNGSHACTVTTHPFPGHFWQQNEAGALGVDQHRELAKALGRRPVVIVTGLLQNTPGRDPRANAMVRTMLTRDYLPRRVVDTYMFDAPEPIIIWQRRDRAG